MKLIRYIWRDASVTGSLWLTSIILLLLTGWSNVYAAAETEVAAPRSEVFRIGYRLDAAPFSYKNDAGEPAGYTVEICKRVVVALQAEMSTVSVDYVALTLEERGPALLAGRVDLLCGADTVTLGRREWASFSMPIFIGGIGALMHADAPTSLQLLLEGVERPVLPRWRTSFTEVFNNSTFVTVKGSLAESWLAEAIDQFRITAELVAVADYATGVAQVLAGNADVLFGDRAILLDAAAGADEDELIVVGRRFTDETIALTMARGDEDLRLLVDRTLSGLYRSGEIVAIYSAFFGNPDQETLQFFRINTLPE